MPRNAEIGLFTNPSNLTLKTGGIGNAYPIFTAQSHHTPNQERKMTIIPPGEEIRNAVKWISEMRRANPGSDPRKLVEQACLKFNLSPLEAQYLERWIKE
jgi:hypothetical protein